MNVQVVSDCGNECERPCGNGQFCVDLSRNTHDRFRKGQDVVIRGNALNFN